MLDAHAARRTAVGAALGSLVSLAADSGARALAQRLRADVLEKLEADRFHLVVVGEFNHGKTTFVNALLGAEVLPVGVTPTTAAIHHVVWSEEPRAAVARASGLETIPFDALASYRSGGSADGEDVQYVEVGYPAELLRERLVLVDTPGVNDLSLQRAEITYGYVPRSDAVLFLLDAGQPLKESERQFLQTQLLARSRDKIVFVVAKTDIWSPAEREEALAYVRAELARLVPEPRVVAVSAVAALTGRRGESGLDELALQLGGLLERERGRILLDNALDEGLRGCETLRRGLEAKRRSATLGLDDLTRKIRMLEEDLAGHAGTIEERRLAIAEETAAIKAWARRDLDRFVDDVARALPGQLADARGEEIKAHLGAFLEATFREWANAETDEIAGALEALAEKTVALVREDARAVGRRVGESAGAALESPNVDIDTLPYDVGIFAMFTLGLGVVFANALLGGMLLLGAPALAVWVRDRTEIEIRKRALELAPAALRDAAAKVGPKIAEMIDEFRAGLDRWVVATGAEVHREVIDVLAGAREARQRDGADAEALAAVCDGEATRLAEVRERLETLRAELWSGREVAA